MELSSVLVYAIFTGLGVLIGYNLRNSFAEKKEQQTLDSIDQKMRNDLMVAENLNKSLLEDVTFLRKKVAGLSKDLH